MGHILKWVGIWPVIIYYFEFCDKIKIWLSDIVIHLEGKT